MKSLKINLSSKSIVNGIFLGLVLVLLIHLGLYIYNASIVLPSDLTLGYGEGYHVAMAKMYMSGNPPYHSINVPPYVCCGYAPLYHIVTGIFSSFLGYELWVGRTISFVSALLTSLFIFLIVRKITKSHLAGLIGSLVFFLPPVVKYWTLLYRVDTLGLLFSIIGIYLAIKYCKSWKVLWSIPLFVLAFFTKQSFIAAPIAVGLYLLFTSRKKAFAFSSIGLCIGGLILLIGNLLTKGEFSHHILGLASSMPLYWSNFTMLYGGIVKSYFLLILPAVVSIMFHLKKKIFGILDIYFIISALTLISIAKEGSWYNYALEILAVCSILIGCLIPWMLKSLKEISFPKVSRLPEGLLIRKISSPNNLVSGFLSLFIIFMLIGIASSTNNYQKLLAHPHPEQVGSTYSIIEEYIRSTPEPVLCENAYLLFKVNRPILWEPSAFVQYSKSGIWNQSGFVDSICNKEYGLIIQEWNLDIYFSGPPEDFHPARFWIAYQRCTYEIACAMRDNYKLIDIVGTQDPERTQEGEVYYVYAPK